MLFRVVKRLSFMYVPAIQKANKIYPRAEKIQMQHTERM